MAKIILTAARDIALDKLVASDANVRRIKAGVSVEDLAEDIARRGLLQSLSVRPVADDDGAETGQFTVSAGGRRLAALKLLVKQKRLAKSAAVPCIVKTDGIEEEDSLAENTMREALHPLDQFRAFKSLQDQGVTIDEIAARFFVGAQVVRQRLKLAAASQKLLDLYVADDHTRQEEVWETLSRSYNKEPYTLRRLLTEGAVKAGDKRAVFVGVDAYEAAGGVVLRDLFQHDHGGWLQDVALLDRLAREKLAETAELRAEGWKWSQIAIDFPYGHTNGLRRLPATYAPVSEEQQARYDAALAEYDALSDEHEGAEDLPEEVDRRLAELEKEMASVDERPAIYDPTELSRAGIFVSIDYDGALKVERGFVRPEDEEPAGAPAGGAPRGSAGVPKPEGDSAVNNPDGNAADQDETEVSSKLSDRLMSDLTAHRTLALRVALANDPEAAFLAATHALALKSFYASGRFDGCIEIEIKSAPLGGYATGLADSATARALNEAQGRWQLRLPKKSDDLWDWLVKADRESTAGLFAFCVGQSVNALELAHERRSKALDHADRLAEHVGLDMSAHWTPTVESYFGKVTKARILAAVREAKGEATAQMIDHLKKSDMAIEAERLLQGMGWLPEPLRDASMAAADTVIAQTEASGALPDFLGDEDDGFARR